MLDLHNSFFSLLLWLLFFSIICVHWLLNPFFAPPKGNVCIYKLHWLLFLSPSVYGNALHFVSMSARVPKVCAWCFVPNRRSPQFLMMPEHPRSSVRVLGLKLIALQLLSPVLAARHESSVHILCSFESITYEEVVVQLPRPFPIFLHKMKILFFL